MPIAQTDALFNLIKSMDKAEKRNFKLYVNRLSSNEDVKFKQVFELLDKMTDYDETVLLQKLKHVKKAQFANIKRHLYSQILKSLRLIHVSKNMEIQIREHIDYAHILYDKGLYHQSLQLLDRIKPLAVDTNQHLLYFEILEFEKLIESRHITRSRKIANKMESLIEDSAQISKVASMMSSLSNLMLKIQGFYINWGYVKHEKDKLLVKEYFQSNLPGYELANLGFVELNYVYISYLWYHYILMEFDKSAEYALSAVRSFEENPIMIDKDPNLYMRVLHYALTCLYYTQRSKEYDQLHDKFQDFIKDKKRKFNPTSRILYFSYGLNASLNKHLMAKDYKQGLSLMPEIEREIKKYQMLVDPHRSIIYYYKLAWMFLLHGQAAKALDQINKIVLEKNVYLKDDLYIYSRFLQILIHLKLKHYKLVLSQMQSLQRTIGSTEDNLSLIKSLMGLFQKMIHQMDFTTDKWRQVRELVQKMKKDPFERKAFIYFDFEDWADKN